MKKYEWNVFDKILLIMAIFILLFVIINLIIFVITGAEPSTLITCVFALCTGECGFMAWIERRKKQVKEDEDE